MNFSRFIISVNAADRLRGIKSVDNAPPPPTMHRKMGKTAAFRSVKKYLEYTCSHYYRIFATNICDKKMNTRDYFKSNYKFTELEYNCL